MNEEALMELVDHVADCFHKIIDALKKMIKAAVNVFSRLWPSVLGVFSSRRVIYLAKYGRTKRIRKKNRHRIMKDFVKMIKSYC